MHFTALTLITALAAAFPDAGVSTTPPIYNIDHHCTAVLTHRGQLMASLYDACIVREANFFNELAKRWRFFEPDIRRECDSFARGGPDGSGDTASYFTLRNCVWKEEVEMKKHPDL